jgi:hypothetical protein
MSLTSGYVHTVTFVGAECIRVLRDERQVNTAAIDITTGAHA